MVAQLRAQGRNPYLIPVGGSSALGCWGYLQCVAELQAQAAAAGLALTDVAEVALATGVVLDPVYTGKAVHALLGEMRAAPEAWRGRAVAFLHTGGLLGLYEQAPQLAPLVEGLGRVQRMRVPG
jgi:1-aminocyclopropane-1-carboxylate deaminase/D-cysteine desulfhydrase-like pyridoxal-dependent ACC family enzyme